MLKTQSLPKKKKKTYTNITNTKKKITETKNFSFTSFKPFKPASGFSRFAADCSADCPTERPSAQVLGTINPLLFPPQLWTTRTALWTTGTATTAAKPVTVCLHGTTPRPSPTPPYTSILWGRGCSSSIRTRAPTPSTALTWTTGIREESGRARVQLKFIFGENRTSAGWFSVLVVEF